MMWRRWRTRDAIGCKSGVRSFASRRLSPDDTEDGARVEVGGSQQTHLGQDREFLGLVDEQERAHTGVVEMASARAVL